MIPTNLWRDYPFVDVRRVSVIAALSLSACSLVFSGCVMLSVGSVRLGGSMIAAGVLAIVAAAQVEW